MARDLARSRWHRFNGHLAVLTWPLLVCLLLCASAADASSPSAYKIAPGDRLTITVLGQAELSGDFPVDAAGAILLPIIGVVDVDGLTIAETQRRLTERLADGVLTDPSVFVRIGEMRPIQVLGDVRTPGSYPFRYGTLVKSAVAIAGGFGLPLQTRSIAFSEYLTAEERLRVLDATRARLSVREARIRAQLDGAKSFDPPAPAPGTADPDTIKIVNDERDAFQARTREFEKQIKLIEAQKPPLIAESDAIDGQIASEKKQVDLLKTQVEAYEKLQKNGLTKLDAMIQVQLNVATKESSLWRLEADRSRLRTSIGELGIRAQEAEMAYRKQIALELQEVVQKLHEATVSLPVARQIRDNKLREAGSITGSANHEYVITRTNGREVATFAATDTTVIQPGDVLEVKIPAETGSPLASLTSRNMETASAPTTEPSSAQPAPDANNRN